MMPHPTVPHFNAFARTTYSQHGEDGIIGEILCRLGDSRDDAVRHCVECGAWDGRHFSNTRELIEKHGYHAVLIEGDPRRCATLRANSPHAGVIAVNAFVGWEGATSLDAILSSSGLPHEFDFLSIDVDGNDYHLLDSLRVYRPALICIEFNPSIPNAVEYVQPRDPRIHRGSSARAIASLASAKGYAVVAATRCNLFLLQRRYLATVGLAGEPALDDVRDDRDATRYIFCGMDGTILLSAPLLLHRHGLEVCERDFQVLPGWLRRFPADYTALQRAALRLLRGFRRLRRAAGEWRR